MRSEQEVLDFLAKSYKALGSSPTDTYIQGAREALLWVLGSGHWNANFITMNTIMVPREGQKLTEYLAAVTFARQLKMPIAITVDNLGKEKEYVLWRNDGYKGHSNLTFITAVYDDGTIMNENKFLASLVKYKRGIPIGTVGVAPYIYGLNTVNPLDLSWIFPPSERPLLP